MEGRQAAVKEGYLKKINALTSARFYFVLDAETLTWWPDKKDAGPRREVEPKHRLLLRNFLAVVGTRNAQGDEFEITYAQGEGGKGNKEHRSVVLRADKGEGRVWVRALLEAKEELSRHMGAAMSTWLRKLNGCQVPGCEHAKLVRGFCAQHFRLFFGEDPQVEIARAELSQAGGGSSSGGGSGQNGGGDGAGGSQGGGGVAAQGVAPVLLSALGRSARHGAE